MCASECVGGLEREREKDDFFFLPSSAAALKKIF